MNNRVLLSGILPMPPRDSAQAHRAATPLELLFDLVSVIAIAAAAAGLHHAIAEAHVAEGLIKFVLVFFAIWWAWMNYTWFASAYDNDDALFRLLTMAIMAGALTMAAGVRQFFANTDITLIVAGFVIMRLGMVALWLRAAKHDPERRATALWYGLGIAIVQCYWVWLALAGIFGKELFFSLYALGALLELSVPLLAERKGITPWHRHHIIERYGLLNIIVLGETLLAGSMALGQAAGDGFNLSLVRIALSALVILFAMWWLYFAKEDHLAEKRMFLAFTWGYGHLLIFIAGAAVGAGFAVMVDIVTGHAQVGIVTGRYAVAIPVAIYWLGLWFVRDWFVLGHTFHGVLPLFAVLILLAPLMVPLEGIALLAILSVYVRSRIACPVIDA